MIEHTLDPTNAILHIRPQSALEQADFERLAKTVDPYIAGTGDLAGIIVETPGLSRLVILRSHGRASALCERSS